MPSGILFTHSVVITLNDEIDATTTHLSCVHTVQPTLSARVTGS